MSIFGFKITDLNPILNYLLRVLEATGIHLAILFGPLLAAGFLMHYLSGWNERLTMRLVGRSGYLMVFGWLGTAVHELGHALFALLFGHRIEEMKLFSPDPKTGTLGYVKHSWNRKNLYHIIGNFFIGIGPILLGTLVLFLVFFLLYGRMISPSGEIMTGKLQDLPAMIMESAKQFLMTIFTGEQSSFWKTFLLVYILFSVGGSVKLSGSDIQGAAKGFLFIVLLLLAFNLVTLWSGDYVRSMCETLSGWLGGFYLLFILSLLINLFFTCLLGLLNLVRQR